MQRTEAQQNLINVTNGWSGRTGAPGNLLELADKLDISATQRPIVETFIQLMEVNYPDLAAQMRAGLHIHDAAVADLREAAKQLQDVAAGLEQEWPAG